MRFVAKRERQRGKGKKSDKGRDVHLCVQWYADNFFLCGCIDDDTMLHSTRCTSTMR